MNVRAWRCRNSGCRRRQAAAAAHSGRGPPSAARWTDPSDLAEALGTQCRRVDGGYLRRDCRDELHRPSWCRAARRDGARVPARHSDDDNVRRRDGRRCRLRDCTRAWSRRRRAGVCACGSCVADRSLFRADLHDRHAGLRSASLCIAWRAGPCVERGDRLFADIFRRRGHPMASQHARGAFERNGQYEAALPRSSSIRRCYR